MGLARFVSVRLATMAAVLLATLLVTVLAVGSNMDSVLQHGVAVQVRAEVSSNPSIAAGFEDTAAFEAYVQDLIDARTAALGLDEPWYSPQRVGPTMYRILVLDFGHATFLTGDSGSTDVREIIYEKLPRTVLLFTTATVVISLIGIFAGASSASRPGSPADRATSAFAVLSSSFPVWWVGLLMIFAFSFTYQVFPARATPDLPPGDPGYVPALLYHMALPLITLVLIGFGSWAYLVRNFMVGIMQEDFVAAKRAAGVPRRRLLYRHALRNAAPPIATVMALSLSGSLGGAIITEAVFDWPGMGRLYFEAISVMDLPVIIGSTYVLTAFFLSSVLAADLLYGYLDPRVRSGR